LHKSLIYRFIMKHVHHLKAKSYHINRFGEVSTPFLFWYMQEIAWEHAHKLGFGFEHLREDRLFWVLSRLLVKIDRRPRWTEDFTLETWSRGTDGFFAYRDYRFLDTSGHELIKATSSWLVLDLTTRRIQRLDQNKEFPVYTESVLGYNAGKVASAPKGESSGFIPVQFTEIDINQHFNTGRYLERINNSYPVDFQRDHKLAELEVNFLKEGLPGDSLAVNRQHLSQEEHLCSVVRESDGNDLIRARLLWQPATPGF
jgi:medium-chain acyl-[acyl-carrier-protein] hydrolase